MSLNKLIEGLEWLNEEGRNGAKKLETEMANRGFDSDHFSEATSWLNSIEEEEEL